MKEITNDFRSWVRSEYPGRMSSVNGMIKALQSPYILEERELHVTQMDIFSRLMRDRIIMFLDQVNPETAGIISAQLQYLDNVNPGEKITLQINSGGGEVYSGYGLIETMN